VLIFIVEQWDQDFYDLVFNVLTQVNGMIPEVVEKETTPSGKIVAAVNWIIIFLHEHMHELGDTRMALLL
jgi:hypothetical protein